LGKRVLISWSTTSLSLLTCVGFGFSIGRVLKVI
jgi:hypothetical protein